MALYRAQILLEEEQHHRLEDLARESGRSMSELVREILAEHLTRLSEDESIQRSLTALDELARFRAAIAGEHGQLEASFLNSLRDERDGEVAGDTEIAGGPEPAGDTEMFR